VASPVLEIVPAQIAPSTQTTLYTSPAGITTRIDKLSVQNNDGSSHTISINLVPSGASVGASNRTTNGQVVLPAQTWNSPNEYGHYLNPGDAISVIASTAGQLVILVGGTQVS
jgi:hypothetical protein